MKLKAMWTDPRNPSKVEPVLVVGFMGDDDRFSLIVVRGDGKISKVNKMDVRVDVAALEEPRATDRVVSPSGLVATPVSTPVSSDGGGTQSGEVDVSVATDDEASDRVAAAKEYNKQQVKNKKLASTQAET